MHQLHDFAHFTNVVHSKFFLNIVQELQFTETWEYSIYIRNLDFQVYLDYLNPAEGCCKVLICAKMVCILVPFLIQDKVQDTGGQKSPNFFSP